MASARAERTTAFTIKRSAGKELFSSGKSLTSAATAHVCFRAVRLVLKWHNTNPGRTLDGHRRFDACRLASEVLLHLFPNTRSCLISRSLTKDTVLIHSLRSDVIGLTKETKLLVWCHIWAFIGTWKCSRMPLPATFHVRPYLHEEEKALMYKQGG